MAEQFTKTQVEQAFPAMIQMLKSLSEIASAYADHFDVVYDDIRVGSPVEHCGDTGKEIRVHRSIG